MTALAEAAAAVRAARRRLVLRSALDGAARGVLVGTIAGGLAWGAASLTSAGAGLWPLAAPVIGALTGAALALRGGVAFDAAALTLDAAAGTDEAFVSATSEYDAVPEFRALSAGYAVTRCPPSAVGRFLPLRAPAVAAAAAVSAAILAALVLVPRAGRVAEPEWATGDDENAAPVAGGRSGGGDRTSPRSRVEQLTQRVEDRSAAAAPSFVAAVRKDLGAVTNDDLRRLAEKLAAEPASADAAKRALAALDRGDRTSAAEALREALGGTRSVASDQGTGTGTASEPAAAAARAPWTSPTWPLRYDRVVRRWLEETAVAEGTPK